MESTRTVINEFKRQLRVHKKSTKHVVTCCRLKRVSDDKIRRYISSYYIKYFTPLAIMTLIVAIISEYSTERFEINRNPFNTCFSTSKSVLKTAVFQSLSWKLLFFHSYVILGYAKALKQLNPTSMYSFRGFNDIFMVTITFATLLSHSVSQSVSPFVNQSTASVGSTFLRLSMKHRAERNSSSCHIGSPLSWSL